MFVIDVCLLLQYGCLHNSNKSFVPVNPFLTPLRNQGMQKLATFHPSDYWQLLIVMLSDTKRRQASSATNNSACACARVCACIRAHALACT